MGKSTSQATVAQLMPSCWFQLNAELMIDTEIVRLGCHVIGDEDTVKPVSNSVSANSTKPNKLLDALRQNGLEST